VKATIEIPMGRDAKRFGVPRRALIEAALEGLVAANQVLIRHGIVPASPFDANVVYKLEPPGEEDWKLAWNVIRDGWGDCEDLNGWECAGIRETSDPGARVRVVRTGVNKLHCIGQLSDGSYFDVCPALGMRPKDR